MARQDLLQALGTVYSKTTTGMTTSYTNGTTQYTGNATRLTLFGAIVLVGGTSVTSYSVQVGLFNSAGVFFPIPTVQNDSSITTAITQTIAVTAGATTNFTLQTASIAPSCSGWVVRAKANGAAGTTAESITITGDVM